MTVRAVVFDIGGMLEQMPGGGEPILAFPQLLAQWEPRLRLQPDALRQQLREMDERLRSSGKDGALGTCSEEEWQRALREATGMDQVVADAFMRDFWDVYLGELNVELATYCAGLRPRYQTALLSNSFVGARRREQECYKFAAMSDLIVYSHEEGIAKPDTRIFALTCARLGVQPGEVIFVDDAEPHIAAARACGMHAILFSNTQQAIAEIEARLQAQAV
jgi:epoxide hydrolase-like predicted phosphatase